MRQGESSGRSRVGRLWVAHNGTDAAIISAGTKHTLHIAAAIETKNELSEETHLCFSIMHCEPAQNIIHRTAV